MFGVKSVMSSVFGGGGGGGKSMPKAGPKPDRPDILDGNNFVQEQFRINGQMTPQERMSQQLTERLYNTATSQGPSQSAQYLMDENQRNANRAMGDAVKSNGSQFQSLLNSASMRGGLDRGSRMRGLNNLNQANMNSRFNTLINKQNNDLDILQKDEANKQQLQQSTAGQLMDQANFDMGKSKFDILNSLNTANNFYNQDMQAWAANNAAKQSMWAAKNTGGLLGSGGILGSGFSL